jgi:hypothetical protein
LEFGEYTLSQTPDIGSLVGKWTYRSFLNDADLAVGFDKLEFGRGTIVIHDAPMGVLRGTIGGPGWSLNLNGSINYGDPYSLRFQGTSVVDGEPWSYDYTGYAIKPWPNGINQVPAIVGSVVRTVAHSQGEALAGVVCSFIAVWQGPIT